MNDYELRDIRETFSTLFVLAKHYKMNFYSFTNMLERSIFIYKLEKNVYDDYFNSSIEKIFSDVTDYNILSDNSYGIYNDAYWCGQTYFDLHYKLNKSFSYLFLKLPLERMLDLFNVYHEMDFSSLVLRFREIEKEKTIIRLLCERKHCSVNDISIDTGINVNTLIKYNASDKALLSASFQNIVKLICYLDVPYHLFIK